MPPRRPARRVLEDEIYRESPELAQSYLSKTLDAYASGEMGGFRSDLQGIRENAVRRGITGGDLGTSYEGDLSSAFQRNLSNVAGSYANQNFQASRDRYLDLLTGQRDADTAEENARRRRGGVFGRIPARLRAPRSGRWAPRWAAAWVTG